MLAKPGCECCLERHACRLIAVTGGPGAGKTAVLEVARRLFCKHVVVLREAAGVVYGGGFPRGKLDVERRAGQCAIYHVQRQLERVPLGSGEAALALCDRGTIDGLAYWPGSAASYWQEVGSSLEVELARYAAVVHLRTPPLNGGYNQDNPLRIESAAEAAAIDERILEAWQDHPRRTIVESSRNFLEKVTHTVDVIRSELPPCCEPAPHAASIVRVG